MVIVAVLGALAGCGGDDGGTVSTQSGPGAATSTEGSGRKTGREEPGRELAGKGPPSRRDVQAKRELERALRQEALVGAGGVGGWKFADVRDVRIRGTAVVIETRLGPRRRDAAASLCLAARRFFLQGGQGQTAYDVVVAGRAGSALGRC